MNFSLIFLLFILYSFLGWIMEVIYCSIIEHRLVNRGFLHGPFCPVYGFGGLLVVFLLKPFENNIFMLFLVAVLVTSVLEYVTSWILEKLFATKWWDYSTMRFNIHGRVCLLNSVMFGALGVIAVRFVHPFIMTNLEKLPGQSPWALSGILAILLMLDTATTLATLLDLDRKLVRLHDFTESLKERLDVREWLNETDLMGALERLKSLALDDKTGVFAQLSGKLEALLERNVGIRRLVQAFPSMRSRRHAVQLEYYKKLHRLKNDAKTAESGEQEKAEVFVHGRSFYRAFWIFLVSSFFGVLIEMVWCVITRGYIASRTGLIYGWINPVYGIGALLITVLLSRQKKRSNTALFLGGVFVGGVFETLCSMVQEFFLGTVSWEYSDSTFNLLGRSNLIFCVMWGVLVLLWAREVYPSVSHLIALIPVRLGKIVTVLLFILLVADAGISVAAVHRWTGRTKGVPSANAVGSFLDRHYPDPYMKKIYPNMQFVK